jgi:hypothetical protein
MTLRGLRFVLGVCLRALRDYVFGITCASCGAHARLPVPRDWRWLTSWDGKARWACGECRRADDDAQWMH